MAVIAAEPQHLDHDWFGKPDNWWVTSTGFPKGDTIEQRVTDALIELIEASFGLPTSGVEPTTWTWPDKNPTGARDWVAVSMTTWASWGTAPVFENITIEWQVGALTSFVADVKGSTLRIRTPLTTTLGLPQVVKVP